MLCDPHLLIIDTVRDSFDTGPWPEPPPVPVPLLRPPRAERIKVVFLSALSNDGQGQLLLDAIRGLLADGHYDVTVTYGTCTLGCPLKGAIEALGRTCRALRCVCRLWPRGADSRRYGRYPEWTAQGGRMGRRVPLCSLPPALRCALASTFFHGM